MIIPRSASSKIKKGDKVIVTKDIYKGNYIVTTGHVLIYVGEDAWGPALLDEETGITINKISRDWYSKWVDSIDTGQKIEKQISDKIKFLEFIVDNCPKKDYTYEERDRVDTCKVGKGKDHYPVIYCKPSVECFQYIPEEKYKDNSFILDYNRRIKLKKLKDGLQQ